MTALDDDPVDSDIKARSRAMWAMGDYPAVARDVIAALDLAGHRDASPEQSRPG